MMPNDFPHWKTTYHYFRLWAKQGVWLRIHDALRDRARLALGKKAPTAAILDSQSVRTALRYQVRYFTDGAVIGSNEFVNEAFDSARDRFSETRRDGARRMRGKAAAPRELWSMRALRVGIEQLEFRVTDALSSKLEPIGGDFFWTGTALGVFGVPRYA